MACSDLDYRWGMRTNEWRGLTAGHPRRPDSTMVGALCFVLGGSGRSPVAGLLQHPHRRARVARWLELTPAQLCTELRKVQQVDPLTRPGTGKFIPIRK